jgi:hypothetical protein
MIDNTRELTCILKTVRDVAGGTLHCLALLEDGSLWSWGKNANGELGVNSVSDVFIPARISEFLESGESIIGIGCGLNFSWVVTQKGSLYMWGGSKPVGMDAEILTPKKHGFHVDLPRTALEVEWREVFFWISLGRADDQAFFSGLPVEVVFAMTKIFFLTN